MRDLVKQRRKNTDATEEKEFIEENYLEKDISI